MIVCSAPGKILWIGGYAVLERPNVSFITGVDCRVYAKASELEEGSLEIKAPQFSINAKGSHVDGKVLIGEEKAKFVKTAIETCFNYLEKKGSKVKGVKLETFTDPEFGFGESKTGLGSSAAVCVASVAAIMGLHGFELSKNKEIIHKLAQYSHNTAQGKVGSGFDVAASCFGASAYVRYSPVITQGENLIRIIDSQWDYQIQNIKIPENFRLCFANIVGESMSTSDAIKKMNEWKATHPNEFKEKMHLIDEADRNAVEALKEGNDSKFREWFKETRVRTKELMEEIGTAYETPELSRLVEESEGHGAFVCKLPGAGGGDAIAAFCTSEEELHKLRSFWNEYKGKKLEVLSIGISNEGARAESLEVFYSKH